MGNTYLTGSIQGVKIKVKLQYKVEEYKLCIDITDNFKVGGLFGYWE